MSKSPFPKGTIVRQKMPPPEVGVVRRFDVDQETGERQYLVEWPDTEVPGLIHSGYYLESEIENGHEKELPVAAPDTAVAPEADPTAAQDSTAAE